MKEQKFWDTLSASDFVVGKLDLLCTGWRIVHRTNDRIVFGRCRIDDPVQGSSATMSVEAVFLSRDLRNKIATYNNAEIPQQSLHQLVPEIIDSEANLSKILSLDFRALHEMCQPVPETPRKLNLREHWQVRIFLNVPGPHTDIRQLGYPVSSLDCFNVSIGVQIRFGNV
jgi:hypothetical protein